MICTLLYLPHRDFLLLHRSQLRAAGGCLGVRTGPAVLCWCADIFQGCQHQRHGYYHRRTAVDQHEAVHQCLASFDVSVGQDPIKPGGREPSYICSYICILCNPPLAPACNLMQPHATSCNLMQPHATSCSHEQLKKPDWVNLPSHVMSSTTSFASAERWTMLVMLPFGPYNSVPGMKRVATRIPNGANLPYRIR